MGGPIYNLEYYRAKARNLRDMGADSICIKDMGGLLAPYDAYEIVSALKQDLDLPIQLHCHYTSGMASMSALKAVEAGLDILDVCLAPLALRTSQPAVEPIAVALGGGERDPGLDLDKLLEIGDQLEAVLPKYAEHMQATRAAVIDPGVLKHQIPGGMASNLVSQLREADAVDRLGEVLDEIVRTRAELGYPPLVTPMSQMVGAQAVTNVLFGRYAAVSEPVKEYVRGGYGKPVSEIDADLLETLKAQDGTEPGAVPDHPGDAIDPELDAAREAVSDLTSDIDDALIYALYPQTGERFLRVKHGVEQMPEAAPAPAQPQSSAAQPAETAQPAQPLSARARRFNVHVGGQMYEVDVDPVGGTSVAASGAAVGPAPAQRAAQSAATPSAESAAPTSAAPTAAEGESHVTAPMPGMLVSLAVEVGERVSAGQPLLVLEAMKMQNTIPCPADGTVTSLPVAAGTQVTRDQVLAVIGEG